LIDQSGRESIRSLGVQASSGRDRRQSSPSVAIQIELASPARRTLLRVAVMVFGGAFLSLSGSTS
jgi:hypothetical protein